MSIEMFLTNHFPYNIREWNDLSINTREATSNDVKEKIQSNITKTPKRCSFGKVC